MLPHYLVTMMSKQVINDELRGSVDTYLRCGGVVNNQIKKGLMLSLRMTFFVKSVNIWQSYKQEDGCLVHFVCLATAMLKVGRKCTKQSLFLPITMPNIHRL